MMIGGDRNVVERRQARRLTSRRAWILAVSARNTTAEPVQRAAPPGLANTEQAKRLYEHGCVTVMDIVQLIYRPIEPQGSDAHGTLQASPWLAAMPTEVGVRVFDTPRGSLNEDCSTAS